MMLLAWLPLFGVVLGGAGQPSAPAPRQPERPATEVYLASIERSPDGNISVGAPGNISNDAGYDNQPAFLLNGTVLFTSSRDGNQTDIYQYDPASKALTPLTRTPESEYSPTPEDDRTFRAVRVEADGTQRVAQFRIEPAPVTRPETIDLPDVKPVGYFALATKQLVVLFVLGDPATLRIANLATRAVDIVAERPGRCLARMRNGNVSFVQKGAAKEPWQIMELDVHTRRITPLVETLEGREDYAWLPDGRLLMASGTQIFLWDKDDRVPVWKGVADLASAGVDNITRLAVSHDGKKLAFVAEQSSK